MGLSPGAGDTERDPDRRRAAAPGVAGLSPGADSERDPDRYRAAAPGVAGLSPGAGDTERDRLLDTLLGPGSQVRSGGPAGPGGTLVGGIGLPWLRDLDFGANWLARAAPLPWPDGVVLEDLSYGAHRVMHRLEELRPRRVVLIACMPRGSDPAGTVRRWSPAEVPLPDPSEVHERLAEAVGGIIDLDHTIAVCRHWDALPPDTTVIEVEPAESHFGLGFSAPVTEAVDRVLDMVLDEVLR